LFIFFLALSTFAQINAQDSKINQDYVESLKQIDKNDQKERKKRNLDWEIQNRLDSINRVELDALYEKYGFPSQDIVTRKGLNHAFMVLHHSVDCEWNKKWTPRFLGYADKNMETIFSFYFHRNFNQKDGFCREEKEYLEELKAADNAELVNHLLTSFSWDY
ncbi:MAG: hypothetical protein AAGC47_15660, partial [Bacteroidota bacterium]